MPPLIVVGTLAVIGLLTVMHALYRDAEELAPPRQLAPDWDLLPSRTDLARVDFGQRFPGYDPTTVEARFDALADIYTDLLAAADEATVDRARRAIADRLGVEAPPAGRPARAPGRRSGRPSDVEAALVAEVALQQIELEAIERERG